MDVSHDRDKQLFSNSLTLKVHLCSGSHQGPEDWKDSRSSQDKQPPQSLWVVGLHDLDDPQQRFDPRPPQVTHVQTLEINQTRPAAAGEEQKGLAAASSRQLGTCHPQARLKRRR